MTSASRPPVPDRLACALLPGTGDAQPPVVDRIPVRAGHRRRGRSTSTAASIPAEWAGRAAHHRFPADPAAVARAGAVSDRSLDPRHARRAGGRLPQHAARQRPAHAPGARSAMRARRPTASTCMSTSTATAAPATTSPCCCPTASSMPPSPTRTSSARDWDGNWKHAVARGRRRLVGGDADPVVHRADAQARQDGKRTLGIYARSRDRRHRRAHVVARGELRRPRFLSDFAQGGGARVQPVAAGGDAVRRRACTTTSAAATDFDAGADIFWKPNGQTSSSPPPSTRTSARSRATTWWSTSAPTKPSSATSARSSPRTRASSSSVRLAHDSSQLIYTRRVGGPADDGSGAGDITAAVKVNGSVGATQVRRVRRRPKRTRSGATSARCAWLRDFGNAGPRRDGHARRSAVPRSRRRPCYEFDHDWSPNAQLGIRTHAGRQRHRSRPASAGARQRRARSEVDYDMGNGWRQQCMRCTWATTCRSTTSATCSATTSTTCATSSVNALSPTCRRVVAVCVARLALCGLASRERQRRAHRRCRGPFDRISDTARRRQ